MVSPVGGHHRAPGSDPERGEDAYCRRRRWIRLSRDALSAHADAQQPETTLLLSLAVYESDAQHPTQGPRCGRVRRHLQSRGENSGAEPDSSGLGSVLPH
ncbi:MAG: hypothetical protein DMG03_27450, partial [Acidobacteria bacterium]